MITPGSFLRILTLNDMWQAGSATSVHDLVETKLAELVKDLEAELELRQSRGENPADFQCLFWHENHGHWFQFWGALVPKKLDTAITPLLKGLGFATIPIEGKTWCEVFGFTNG